LVDILHVAVAAAVTVTATATTIMRHGAMEAYFLSVGIPFVIVSSKGIVIVTAVAPSFIKW
jgi:hypothetical protein